ncbi:hypothetical protein [Dokdonella koreensis]|uniref:Uncharacterized protein n=1 Tax=Dokdonella koreensis DS-123 TaxID=1300342 RepID=A0A160DXR7_9GAMM|nr:hypothetical protein [Dokdonella koreensis]ANB19111.1 Hypothetical protein I596_3121 [Dokdonella koreensis DS-123]
MPHPQKFYLSVGELAAARGEVDQLSFHGVSPESFAATLQAALREPTLWQRWRAMQPDPDEVDPATGASDPEATVTATQTNMHCDVEVVTRLPHAILRHRLDLLVGHHWRLHDVSKA